MDKTQPDQQKQQVAKEDGTEISAGKKKLYFDKQVSP